MRNGKLSLIFCVLGVGAGCYDSDGTTGAVRSLNMVEQEAVPAAAYEAGYDLELPPPTVVSRTVAEFIAHEAKAGTAAAGAYSIDGWLGRLAAVSQELGREITIAVVNGLHMQSDGDVAAGYRINAQVQLASAAIEPVIVIRQDADAAMSSSTWRLRVPKNDDRRYVVALMPTDEPAVYDLVVDFSRDVIGFGFDIGNDVFEMPGGPRSLHLSDLSLELVQ